jgi:hypothetical protein
MDVPFLSVVLARMSHFVINFSATLVHKPNTELLTEDGGVVLEYLNNRKVMEKLSDLNHHRKRGRRECNLFSGGW